jgi:phosphonate transport system substrate-binding protein
MKGKRLALVERATTAGFVFPVAFFKRNGIELEGGFFSSVQFWGSHDAAINAVLEGRADVGAAKSTIWELMSRENPRIDAELEILAVSPNVPSNGLLVSPDVSPEVREQIEAILLGLADNPEAAPVLQQLRFKGFVPTDRQSYDPVFEMATEAGIDLASYTYHNE